MAEMVRYGAEEIFRKGTSGSDGETAALTDADIDALLARGEERTEEMRRKMQRRFDNGNAQGMDAETLLDFSLSGELDYQEFEGERYSASARKRKREELRKEMELQVVHAASEALGKRERKGVRYNEDAYFRE